MDNIVSKKITKVALIALGMFSIGMSMTQVVSATDSEPNTVLLATNKEDKSNLDIGETKTAPNTDTAKSDSYNGVDDQLPSVSIKQANDWANRKGADATSFGQTIARWVAIIGFFFGLIFTIVSAFGGRPGRGLIVIFISLVVYAGSLYGPQIMQYFTNWIGS